MARKPLTWREKEALMRERMLADPTVMEWVKPARSLHRYPEDEPGFFQQTPPPGGLWGLAALGSTFLIPVILSRISPLPAPAPTPEIAAMRKQLIEQGVCPSQANAWNSNEVTPEQISAMLLECRKENGRNQLMFIVGIAAIITLSQFLKEEPIPETKLRAEQVGFSRGYPQFSPSIQRMVKMSPVQQMWMV